MGDLLLATSVASASAFLNKIAGVPAKEVGEIFADKVRTIRVERQLKLLAQTEERLHALGIEPRQVAMKTLFPLLEGAGIEEEPSLQTMWVGLLTTAANSTRPPVPPSFPAMLSQMSSDDARVLDATYAVLTGLQLRKSQQTMQGVRAAELPRALGLDEEVVEVAIENLIRLNLLAPPAAGFTFTDNTDYRYQIQNRDLLCGTPLGWALMAACGSAGPSVPRVGVRSAYDSDLDATEVNNVVDP